MLLTSRLQQTFSLALALTLFSLNMHCPAYAKTDNKRRHRHFLKILTSSNDNSVPSSSDNSTFGTISGEIANKHSFAGLDLLSGTIDDSKATNSETELMKIRGRTRKGNKFAKEKGSKGKDKEPPIVGGSDTQLTLTMMSKFKRTWCKTEPFLQRIKEPGCISRRVMNRFCYGQCNSFYIPRTLRRRTKRKVFKSCGFCRPNRMHTIHVTLKCPGKKKGFKHKKVKQVKHCRCMER